jgi:BirA family biotin operon repressor/biotin-[acetyl-CoA-carboxylase] ligase
MRWSDAQKTLLRTLADGRFHSGADLARALGLSRTAVWGLTHTLEGLGLKLNAVSGKGYRLEQALELLDAQAITAALSPEALPLLARLELHEEIDSTNRYVLALANEGAASGTVCLAERQTAGRGRMGRVWRSPFGANIYLSLLWRFDEHAAVAGLSLAVGVATARALEAAGIAGVGLKWPNDLLWQEAKLGGVLLEIAGEAHGGCAVVVGLGLNRFIPEAEGAAIDQAWTDLTRITHGAPPARNGLAGLLLNELLPLLRDYPQQGLGAHIEAWRARHCHAGRRVSLYVGEQEIRGVVAGVSDAGLLELDCEEGGRRSFASGDVRLRLDA